MNDEPDMIVVVGDPVEGFEFHGPFLDEPEATQYGETHLGQQSWWVIPLTLLEDGDDGGTTAAD